MKKLFKLLKIIVLGALLFWLGGLFLFRYFDPPITATMLIAVFEHRVGLDRRALPLERVSPLLQRAVIASEDGRFCAHNGIDFDAVEDAMADYEERGKMRGASTLSMQVARNVFLWTGGGIVRKVIEAPLALAIDALWPKRRILELYFNIAEWGPGIFGAEAAAQHYFHKPAAALSSIEAARLAAILPNPIRWDAARPTSYIERRTGIIQTRMLQLNRNQLACLR